MSRRERCLVEDCTIVAMPSSSRAILIRDSLGTEDWVPLSQIDSEGLMRGDRADIAMPLWLAQQKSFRYTALHEDDDDEVIER